MKNKNSMSRVVMLFAFLSLTSLSFAQITSEEDMAKAVFETIQNNDLETFTSYCITEDGMTKIINGMEETTPKEKAIKQELQQESVDNCRNESTHSFNLLLKELTDNNIVIKAIELSKPITVEPGFEVTNLKHSEIEFEVSFEKTIYGISVGLFITQGELFIFNFHFYEIDIERK